MSLGVLQCCHIWNSSISMVMRRQSLALMTEVRKRGREREGGREGGGRREGEGGREGGRRREGGGGRREGGRREGGEKKGWKGSVAMGVVAGKGGGWTCRFDQCGGGISTGPVEIPPPPNWSNLAALYMK